MTLQALTPAGIAFLLFLILVFKLHACLALLLTSIGFGVAAGMPRGQLHGNDLLKAMDLSGRCQPLGRKFEFGPSSQRNGQSLFT